MGWMNNKKYASDKLNEKFEGKKYRQAGRANDKKQLTQAKKDLKRLGFKSVRSRKSTKKGYIVYVPARK